MRPLAPRLRHFIPALVLGLAAALAPTAAPLAQWMDVATISTTLGNTNGRLCVGGGKTDIGCPVNAPFLDTAAGLLVIPGDLRVTGNFYVSGSQTIDGVSFANGGVSATGAVTATSFAGDGSKVTGIDPANIVGLSMDRISTTGVASGATLGMVVAQQGTVSFTLGGVQGAAYLHPVLGFVGAGVSTTGPISVTSVRAYAANSGANLGFFRNTVDAADVTIDTTSSGGNPTVRIYSGSGANMMLGANSAEVMRITSSGLVGIGTSDPSAIFQVSGTAIINNLPVRNNYAIGDTSSSLGLHPSGHFVLNAGTSKTMMFTQGGYSSSNVKMIINNGQVGVGGMYYPSTTLHVSGTLQVANGGEACDSYRIGAIKYQDSAFYVCQNTANGWESLATTGVNSLADRITSNSQAGVIANQTGYISLTTGGVTGTVYFTPAGKLVNSGVSTTGTISGTDGYFNMLGIGVSPDVTNKLYVNGNVRAVRYTGMGGSAASPIYTFVSPNLNTGMYMPSPSHIGLSANGVEVIRITSDSTVGIGTSNPTTMLNVNGTLRIADGGEACDASRIGAIKYQNSAFYVCQNTSNGWESLATTGANSLADRITSNSQAGVIANQTGTISLTTGGVTGTVYFTTTGVLVNRGISTTGSVSATRLYVNNSMNSMSFTNLMVNPVTQDGFSLMADTASSTLAAPYNHLNIGTSRDDTASVDDIRFFTNTSAGNFWRMVIKGDTGNIGIGTTTPSSTLDVAGTLTVSTSVVQRRANGALAYSQQYVTGSNSDFLYSNAAGSARMFWKMNTNNIMSLNSSGTLAISGTLQVASGTEACSTALLGAVKYESGAFYICQSVGNGWEALATTGVNSNNDRIVSGTTQVITYKNTSATIATAGVERVVVGTNGNVGVGVQPVAGTAMTVSGTVSTTMVNLGTDARGCTSGQYGTIKFENSKMYVCRQ